MLLSLRQNGGPFFPLCLQPDPWGQLPFPSLPLASENYLISTVNIFREQWTLSPLRTSTFGNFSNFPYLFGVFNPLLSAPCLSHFGLHICSTLSLLPYTHAHVHTPPTHNVLITAAFHACCKLPCIAIICLHDSFQLVQWFLITVVSQIPLGIWLKQWTSSLKTCTLPAPPLPCPTHTHNLYMQL